jgi:hypothetical protein
MFKYILATARWSVAQTEEPVGFMKEGVAYHSSCAVFNYEKKGISLYKPAI